MKNFFVYMLSNKLRTVVYIGVTNDLLGRLYQHRHGEGSQFTKEYRADRLVYYEVFPDGRSAIAREKQLKGWRRTKKDALIGTMNPRWDDLSLEMEQ